MFCLRLNSAPADQLQRRFVTTAIFPARSVLIFALRFSFTLACSMTSSGLISYFFSVDFRRFPFQSVKMP
jgi:hypothetical protein